MILTTKDKSQYKNKFYNKKKNVYTQEDNNSSEESEDEELEYLFMGIKKQDNSSKNSFEIEENSEVEGEVDLEEELINAMDEIRMYKKKNKLTRGQLPEFEEAQQLREKEV
jgi:hypothetical protein